jgi:hypothetical protein
MLQHSSSQTLLLGGLAVLLGAASFMNAPTACDSTYCAFELRVADEQWRSRPEAETRSVGILDPNDAVISCTSELHPTDPARLTFLLGRDRLPLLVWAASYASPGCSGPFARSNGKILLDGDEG